MKYQFSLISVSFSGLFVLLFQEGMFCHEFVILPEFEFHVDISQVFVNRFFIDISFQF